MVRDIRNAPFQWQEKAVMRFIRKSFEKEKGNKLAFAIAVYVCLTEIASNQQSDVFIFTQSALAKMTGLSRTTISEILTRFEKLRLIAREPNYDENGFLIARKYTLLSSTDVHGVNTDVHGVNTYVHGVNTYVHGVNTDVHGVNTDVHGVDTYVHGVDTYVHGVNTDVHGVNTIEEKEQLKKEHIEKSFFSFFSKNETKNSASQNFQKSFIEGELSKDNTNAQPAQENVSNAIPASHSPIPKRNPKHKPAAKAETPEERAFREGYYAFAERAIEWLVAHGCVEEEPSRYWRWAKRLNKTDERITVDVLKHCFNHYVSQRSGTGWRSRAKSFKQFVAAFNEIFQSLSTSMTTNHEPYQAIITDTKLQRDITRSEEWFAVAATIAAQRAGNH